ncbi:MAG: tetratricopeptide repeat protein [Victivallales bacterium]|nr:tetratricopeptide repeat protein [Victivallales bacterium]
METKEIKDIPDNIYNIYQKAIQAFKRNNPDYAIELMKTAVIKEPGFVKARNELRKYELAKEKPGFMGRALKSIKQNKLIKIAQMKERMKKYKEAYTNIENALAINIYTASGLKVLSDIGEAMEAPFIAVEAYDLAVQLFPENIDILKHAAEKYRKYSLGNKELDVRKKIVALKPNDQKLRMQMREASAMATMETGSWENKDDSFQSKLKSKKESARLEEEERVAKDKDEVKELIEYYEDELRENGETIKPLRELGNIYLNIGNYDKAIEKFKKLMEVRNAFDITIDSKIEKAQIKKIEKQIEQLTEEKKKTNSSEEEINKKIEEANKQIKEIHKSKVLNRIKRFPNDMTLRFELGKVYWDENDYESAIEQFQLSQQNLNKRIPSLIYLGRCFLNKKRYDIATDQFKKVLNEERTTTEEILEALYYLGISFEKIGDEENAGKCFKKIYSTKSTYKDVGKIIKKYY